MTKQEQRQTGGEGLEIVGNTKKMTTNKQWAGRNRASGIIEKWADPKKRGGKKIA